MANKDSVVDISSNTQVFKLYNKKGRVRRILCLIFSILFLLGGSGLVYYYTILNSMNFVDISKTPEKDSQQTGATSPSVGELSGSGTQLTIGDGQLLQDSKVLNVMLFGEDNKGEDEHGRTDTMIMMSIDNRHKKLKLTSFQRDTYVYIPGYGNNKSTPPTPTAAPSSRSKRSRLTSASRLTATLSWTLTASSILSTPSTASIWR